MVEKLLLKKLHQEVILEIIIEVVIDLMIEADSVVAVLMIVMVGEMIDEVVIGLMIDGVVIGLMIDGVVIDMMIDMMIGVEVMMIDDEIHHQEEVIDLGPGPLLIEEEVHRLI